jgi:hypothetical protein
MMGAFRGSARQARRSVCALLAACATLSPEAGTAVAQAVGESNPPTSMIAPWAVSYEVPLVDTVARLVESEVPRMLSLDDAERERLQQMLADYRTRLAALRQRALPEMERWEAEVQAIPESDHQRRNPILGRREVAVAGYADEQAVLEEELLATVRDSFSAGREGPMLRCRYLLTRLRQPSTATPIIRVAPDPVAIVGQVLREAPAGVLDAEGVEAATDAFCIEAAERWREVRAWNVWVARHRYRLHALRDGQGSGGGDRSGDRSDAPLLRRSREMNARFYKSVSGLDTTIKVYLERVAICLDASARTRLADLFWQGVADLAYIPWWPRPIEQYREQLARVLAADPERQEQVRAAFQGAKEEAMAVLQRVANEEAEAHSNPAMKSDSLEGDVPIVAEAKRALRPVFDRLGSKLRGILTDTERAAAPMPPALGKS